MAQPMVRQQPAHRPNRAMPLQNQPDPLQSHANHVSIFTAVLLNQTHQRRQPTARDKQPRRLLANPTQLPNNLQRQHA